MKIHICSKDNTTHNNKLISRLSTSGMFWGVSHIKLYVACNLNMRCTIHTWWIGLGGSGESVHEMRSVISEMARQTQTELGIGADPFLGADLILATGLAPSGGPRSARRKTFTLVTQTSPPNITRLLINPFPGRIMNNWLRYLLRILLPICRRDF